MPQYFKLLVIKKNRIMKYIYIILVVLFTTFCQSQIINIKNNNEPAIPGAYYKDIDNLLNPFEGTWVFSDATRSLKITFIKRTNQFDGSYYEDFLIGGYEYKVNNVILVTTLSNLSLTSPYDFKYKIFGNRILKNYYYPPCPECNVGEYRLRLTFSELANTKYGELIARKITVSGQEALKINLSGSEGVYKAGTTPPPDDFVVPCGEYILIKQ